MLTQHIISNLVTVWTKLQLVMDYYTLSGGKEEEEKKKGTKLYPVQEHTFCTFIHRSDRTLNAPRAELNNID